MAQLESLDLLFKDKTTIPESEEIEAILWYLDQDQAVFIDIEEIKVLQ